MGDRLHEATALLIRLYGDSVDQEGNCEHCGAEGRCNEWCVIWEVEEFLGIEPPGEMRGGEDRRWQILFDAGLAAEADQEEE